MIRGKIFFSVCAVAILAGEGVRAEEARSFWAFQKLSSPPLPQPQNAAPARTPVDVFVLAKLEQQALGLSPEADRPTLLRRASYDLLGLPPSANLATAPRGVDFDICPPVFE